MFNATFSEPNSFGMEFTDPEGFDAEFLVTPVPTLQTVNKMYAPSTSPQTDRITADDGYDGLGEVNVIITAMPLATWRGGSRVEVNPTVSIDENGVITAAYNSTQYVTPLSGNGYADRSRTYPVTIKGTTTQQIPSDYVKKPSPIMAGDTPILLVPSVAKRSQLTLGSMLTLTVPQAGTYRFKWVAFRPQTANTYGTQLYKNGVAQGSENTAWTDGNYQANSVDVSCDANDTIEIYGRSGNSSYNVFVGFLTVCIDWTVY